MNNLPPLTNRLLEVSDRDIQDVRTYTRQKPPTFGTYIPLNSVSLKGSAARAILGKRYRLISTVCLWSMGVINGECAQYSTSETSEQRGPSLTSVSHISPNPSNDVYYIEKEIINGLYNSGLIDSSVRQGFPPPVQSVSRTNTEVLPPCNSISVNDREIKSPPTTLTSVPVSPPEANRLITYLDSVIHPQTPLCKNISPRKKALLCYIPDLSYFAYLTTAFLTGNREIINTLIGVSIPYSIHFFYQIPNRVKSCTRFLGRKSEAVAEAPEEERNSP